MLSLASLRGFVFHLCCLGDILSSREKAVAVISLFTTVADEWRFEQLRTAFCRLGETAVVGLAVKLGFLRYGRGILSDSFGYGLERHPLA